MGLREKILEEALTKIANWYDVAGGGSWTSDGPAMVAIAKRALGVTVECGDVSTGKTTCGEGGGNGGTYSRKDEAAIQCQ